MSKESKHIQCPGEMAEITVAVDSERDDIYTWVWRAYLQTAMTWRGQGCTSRCKAIQFAAKDLIWQIDKATPPRRDTHFGLVLHARIVRIRAWALELAETHREESI